MSGTTTRRKPERSCDVCRKQKIKCDGPKAKDGCSHCTYFGLQCTYLQPVKRRGPKKKEAATTNVEQLQQQIAILEAKLRALSVCALCSQPLRTLSESSDSLVPSVDASHPLDNRTEDESADSSDEDDIFVAQFGCISLGPSFSFGAGFDYVLAAKAVIPQDTPPGQKAIKQLEAFNSLSWDDIQPWEQQLYEQTPQYVFPEQDLMDSLICLYFDNVHSTLPILHRESFERSVSEETHKRDHHFAASLLAVLSVASQYSDDPRVLVDGYSTLSSGWKFITQVPILRRGFEPNIYDVQYYFLLALYALTTSKAQDSWIYLGIGIRFLQQRGARRVQGESPEVCAILNDMWGRAFWSFMILDRTLSALFGRPVGLDIDAFEEKPPLPDLDVSAPSPLAKANPQTYLAIYVRICRILGDAIDKVYGHNARIREDPLSQQRQQQIVSELDSEMNDCFNSFPPHLCWDSEPSTRDQSSESFDKAFLLYVTFQYVRIVIHRPYIEISNILAAPSFSICVNAASSIIQAADTWLKARQRLPIQLVVCPLFVAGTTLMMSMFGKQSPRLIPSLDKGKVLINRAMDILEYGGTRRSPDGRLRRLLVQLRYVGRPFAGCTEKDSCAEPTFPLPIVDSYPSSSDKYDLRPGMTIEELLAGVEVPVSADYQITPNEKGILDLTYWMAAPASFSDVIEWDSYLQRNGPEGERI